MVSIIDSLMPVFLVVAAGWLARVTGFVEDRHWPGLERITYVVFFPAIVIETLARANLSSAPLLGVGGALTASILLISAGLLACRKALERGLGVDGPSFTSLFQGSTRWNTFVALAVAASLHGPRGVTLMAVAIASMTPLLNVLAIAVLVRHAGGPPLRPMMVVRTFVTNPFIWSTAAGLALNVLGPPLPASVLGFLDILGRAALAAGLLVVGAGLDMRRLARPAAVHLLSMALKLAVLPLLAATIALSFGVQGADLAIAVIASSVPTSSASFILARQMGGNAPLMAEIITIQTLGALVTMPLMMALLLGP